MRTLFAVSDVVRNSLQDGNLLVLAPFIAMGCEVTSHDPLIVANYFYKGKHESGLKIFLAQTQQNTPKSVSLRRLWHAVYSNSPEKQEAL